MMGLLMIEDVTVERADDIVETIGLTRVPVTVDTAPPNALEMVPERLDVSPPTVLPILLAVDVKP